MFFSREKTVIRNREDHNVSRKNIDPDALRVLYRLSESGFTTYLVGGSVRDLLMGRHPKDFDISTDAHPAQIRKLFRNCYLVGRRFRLAHVVFGRKVIEVSTFRKPPQADEADENVPGGLYQHEDNTFGTPEEDARRRDFTVNGLFYDIRTFRVIDYVGGLRDLERRTLSSIGDPNIRFCEDPVRMMRAVRFAARLDFRMDWSCRRALRRHYAEISKASAPRLLEEIMRLFGHSCSAAAFRLLWEHRLMSVLLPEVHAFAEQSGSARTSLWRHLAAFDQDPMNATASNGLRIAVLLAPIYRARLAALAGGRVQDQGYDVAREILEPLSQRMTLPRQTFYTACMLLDGLHRFEEGAHPSRRMRMARHAMFNEALALRRMELIATGQPTDSLREWEELSAQTPVPDRHAPRPGDQQDRADEPAQMPRRGEDALPAEAQADDEQSPRRRRRPRRRSGRRGAPAGGAASHAPQPGTPGVRGDSDRAADAG
ncbi:MAG: polynucleotide adenylyltransferase PcnB [bacterium]